MSSMTSGNLAYDDRLYGPWEELIGGKVVQMSPSPTVSHNDIAANILVIFKNYLIFIAHFRLWFPPPVKEGGQGGGSKSNDIGKIQGVEDSESLTSLQSKSAGNRYASRRLLNFIAYR